MSNISQFYLKDIWQNAGDAGANRAGMDPQFQNGLLHLVYYLFYSYEGRRLMHEDWRPRAGGPTEAQARAGFKAKCEEFGVRGAAQQALIDGHIAGWKWVEAHEAGILVERDIHEAAFKQHMAAVSWHVWEEATGPLFPLPW